MSEAYTAEAQKRLFASGTELLREVGEALAEVRRAIDGRAYLDVKKEHPQAVAMHKQLVDGLQQLVNELRPMSSGELDIHAWLDSLRALCGQTGTVAVQIANRPDLAQQVQAIGAGAEDRLARAFSPGGLSPFAVGALGLVAIAIGYAVHKDTKKAGELRAFDLPAWDFGGETDAETEPVADEDGFIE